MNKLIFVPDTNISGDIIKEINNKKIKDKEYSFFNGKDFQLKYVCLNKKLIFNFDFEQYDKLDNNLRKKLITITESINDSLVYDINKAKRLDEKVTDKRRIKEEAISIKELEEDFKGNDFANYLLSLIEKKEKFMGICTDSSALIRKKIINEEINVYFFNYEIITPYETHHATILCFDNLGNWLLLNCKRPIDNDYVIIPKTEVKEILKKVL